MAEMKSPAVGREFRHVETGERVTVVEHLPEETPDDGRSNPDGKPAFEVESDDGEPQRFKHPAQFYDTYVRI